jgi:hypothetical protein
MADHEGLVKGLLYPFIFYLVKVGVFLFVLGYNEGYEGDERFF